MAAFFLDTSTILKRYVQETGTAWVQAVAAPALTGTSRRTCSTSSRGRWSPTSDRICRTKTKVRRVLRQNRQTFVDLIHAQMQNHRWVRATRYDVSASRGFEALKPVPFSASEGEGVRDFREVPAPLHDIPKMLFGGFSRCLVSDPEVRFRPRATVRRAAGRRAAGREMVQARTRSVPDLLSRRSDLRAGLRGRDRTAKYLCEPKRASDMDDEVVHAKARAAVEWCGHATDHELAHGGKPWSYVLIPHDAITPARPWRAWWHPINSRPGRKTLPAESESRRQDEARRMNSARKRDHVGRELQPDGASSAMRRLEGRSDWRKWKRSMHAEA